MTLQKLEELRTRADYRAKIRLLCQLWMLGIPFRADLQDGGENSAKATLIGRMGLEVMRDGDTVASRVADTALPMLIYSLVRDQHPTPGLLLPIDAVRLFDDANFDVTSPAVEGPLAVVVAQLLDLYPQQRAALEPTV